VYTRQGVIIVGHGVISKEGITLVKLPVDPGRLRYLKDISGLYPLKIQKHIKNKLGLKSNEEIPDSYHDRLMTADPEPELRKINLKAHEKAFREMKEFEPYIRSKTVRRNTFRTKVRR
jgi:hypothetical protein